MVMAVATLKAVPVYLKGRSDELTALRLSRGVGDQTIRSRRARATAAARDLTSSFLNKWRVWVSMV